MTKKRDDDAAAWRAILRNDFQSFLHKCVQTLNPGTEYLENWHIEAIAYRLGQVTDGDIRRLIINLPPRYLKSTIVSVAYTAFVLGHNPKRRIVAISYGADLATKLTADFRAIVESSWYRELFPQMRIKRATETEVHTTARGFRKSTSVGGVITGFGGDLFILDDPQKPVDAQSEALRNQLNQWVSSTFISRLDDKKTDAIILVMQRVHLHDLVGHLTEKSNAWTVLSLPAVAEEDEDIPVGPRSFHHRRIGEVLHPGRESFATLSELRDTMTPADFAAQYQQKPIPLGGAMIKREWLQYYENRPARERATKIIMSLDTAAKGGAQNDWSVATIWYAVEKRYYLVDLIRGRFEYPLLRESMIDLAERWLPTTILIEDASTGTPLGEEIRDLGRFNVDLVPVTQDKIARLYVQQAKFASGRVLFPRRADYLPQLELELLTFPQGKTDDIVDSITLALSDRGYGYDFTYSGFN